MSERWRGGGGGCKSVFVAKMRGEGVFRETSASFAYLAGRNLYALRVVFLLPPAQYHIHVARRRNDPHTNPIFIAEHCMI